MDLRSISSETANELRAGKDSNGNKIEYFIIGEKTTICLLTTAEGFEIVGASACVNPKDFDVMEGRKWALKDSQDQLEQYEGYRRQVIGATAHSNSCENCTCQSK